MIRKLVTFFDKLEDRVRFRLSHYPIVYALIGAIGIVLVWKGVWETAEYYPILFGPISFILGVLILLMVGLLVSFFIGDNIIMSGFKHEKKLAEQTEREVRSEEDLLVGIMTKIERMEKDIAVLLKR
jgi:uncharacterized protein involved in cysteine biosynthesis